MSEELRIEREHTVALTKIAAAVSPVDDWPVDDAGTEFDSEGFDQYEAAPAAEGEPTPGEGEGEGEPAPGEGETPAAETPPGQTATPSDPKAEGEPTPGEPKAAEGEPTPGEPKAADGEPTPGEGATPKPVGKKAKKAARYSDNHRLRLEAEARATALEASNAALVDQLRKSAEPPAAPPPGAPGAPAPVADPPFPLFVDYDSEPEYEQAVKVWTDAKAAAAPAAPDPAIVAAAATAAADQASRTAYRTSKLEIVKGLVDNFETVKNSLAAVRSPWHNPDISGTDLTPALTFVFDESPKGADVLAYLLEHPSEAQQLANLPPHKPLWTAIAHSTAPDKVLAHFATPAGPKLFEQLAGLTNPADLFMEVGRLDASLLAADTTGVPARKTAISTAPAPATTPKGRTTVTTPSDEGADADDFAAYVEQDFQRSVQQKKQLAGVA